MNVEALKDWSPFALVIAAVGYLYVSRPTRKEVQGQLDIIKDQMSWMINALWEVSASVGASGRLKPPPKEER